MGYPQEAPRLADDARGQALATELGLHFHRCDVGDAGQVNATVAAVLAAHGRIDILVNNAGIFKAADFLEVSEADFDAVLRVNLKGAFLMGQAVARVMATQGGGGIVIQRSTGTAEADAGTRDKSIEHMTDAIRRISIGEGYDPADHALLAFGGAGPQHACGPVFFCPARWMACRR